MGIHLSQRRPHARPGGSQAGGHRRGSRRRALAGARPDAANPRLRPLRVATLRAPLLALLLLIGFPATSSADVGTKIIERCTHGKSISGFSQQAYRRALAELPTEVEEYSDCANLIRRAQLAAAGGGGTGGGGEGAVATPLSPTERSALAKVPRTGALPQRVGGELVHPGVVHANIASAISSLPDPLLAMLAFLLACALALGGRELGRWLRAHRSG